MGCGLGPAAVRDPSGSGSPGAPDSLGLEASMNRGAAVAQVGNLPCRRLAVGRAQGSGGACGLQIRDTADYQSALRRLPGSWVVSRSERNKGPSMNRTFAAAFVVTNANLATGKPRHETAPCAGACVLRQPGGRRFGRAHCRSDRQSAAPAMVQFSAFLCPWLYGRSSWRSALSVFAVAYLSFPH
jgi:hypothetical protein